MNNKISNVPVPNAGVAEGAHGANEPPAARANEPPAARSSQSGRPASNATLQALAQRPSQSPQRAAGSTPAARSRKRARVEDLPRIDNAVRSRTDPAPRPANAQPGRTGAADAADAQQAVTEIENQMVAKLDAVRTGLSEHPSAVSGETLQDIRALHELALLLSAIMQRLAQRSGEALVALTRG